MLFYITSVIFCYALYQIGNDITLVLINSLVLEFSIQLVKYYTFILRILLFTILWCNDIDTG